MPPWVKPWRTSRPYIAGALRGLDSVTCGPIATMSTTRNDGSMYARSSARYVFAIQNARTPDGGRNLLHGLRDHYPTADRNAIRSD